MEYSISKLSTQVQMLSTQLQSLSTQLQNMSTHISNMSTNISNLSTQVKMTYMGIEYSIFGSIKEEEFKRIAFQSLSLYKQLWSLRLCFMPNRI